MSLTTPEVAALEVLATRFEQVAGQPCQPLSRMVLSYAARSMVSGHCILIRPADNAGGVVVERLRQPSAIAQWAKKKLATEWPTP